MSDFIGDDFLEVTYDRAFATLLIDGFHLLLASEVESNYNVSESMARGSLACTMMLPEVVANILIETLKLESSVFGDVDRMSAIGKFDFFLRTTFRSKKLDRGMKQVQALQELKRLRDVFVHPKPQEIHWTLTEAGHYTSDSIKTPIVGIASNPMGWHTDDAIKAMRTVHSFFAFYFVDLCRYSKIHVSSMLFSGDAVPNKSLKTYQYFDRSFIRAMAKWKVDLSYLKIGVL